MWTSSLKLFEFILHQRNYSAISIKKIANYVTRMPLLKTSNPVALAGNSNKHDRHEVKINNITALCTGRDSNMSDYARCINDLNLLQSNRRILSKDASYMFNLFKKQLALSGLDEKVLEKLKVIHVTGTKGKGSTCAFVEGILRNAGLRTGLYSSPHLVEVNERIKIDGAPISNTKFSQYFRPIYNKLLLETQKNEIPMPGYFAFLTIVAFETFLKEKVDCVILEVGIGGQYDSTNVVKNPVVCGISTLDYDHTNILGETIEEIAWTKSGIVKNGAPLFTVEQNDAPEALQVIAKRCSERASSLHICPALDKSGLTLGIEGESQYENAALACQLSNYFLSEQISSYVSDQHLKETMRTDLEKLPIFFTKSLRDCSLPGRCQVIKQGKNTTFFVDGAHTRKSMDNCLKWFTSHSKDGLDQVYRFLILNIIGERDKISILEPLVAYGKFDEVLFTTNKVNVNKVSEERTLKVMNNHAIGETLDSANLNFAAWKSIECSNKQDTTTRYSIFSTVSESINYIDSIMSEKLDLNAHILVTGSLALVGSVLKVLQHQTKV